MITGECFIFLPFTLFFSLFPFLFSPILLSSLVYMFVLSSFLSPSTLLSSTLKFFQSRSSVPSFLLDFYLFPSFLVWLACKLLLAQGTHDFITLTALGSFRIPVILDLFSSQLFYLLHILPRFLCPHPTNGILFTCSPYPATVELGSSLE
jgi:hypothetical protein